MQCIANSIIIINSTQLKFIRKTVARRLKDTHENNDEKQTNKTIKKNKNNERTSQKKTREPS